MPPNSASTPDLVRRRHAVVVGIYVLAVCGLWLFPVFGVMHAESSAVVACIAYFAAGVSALNGYEGRVSFGGELRLQLLLLLVPWALLTLGLLWRPNCGYLQGLVFFLVFPPVTVIFACAVAYAVAALDIRWRRGLMVSLGAGICVAGPLYDFGLHPQFYTYNHIFGGVLGPIYDEELAVRGGLFAFRALTLLWALMALLAGIWLRERKAARRRWPRWIAITAVAIGAVYAFSAPLGINTPSWYLQSQLGTVHRTQHFDIYFDRASVTENELAQLALEHEYHYERLVRLLDVGVPERISSYIYPSPEVKASLTGARYTNVAPVWLDDPQSHVLLDAFDRVFPHELSHVFSRSFGLPVVNASVSVGMVEGLAVALEPPDGLPSPDEQVSAAILSQTGLEAESRNELVQQLVARLTPVGFWTGRGAVSYTTMGSFVRFLIERYGAERVKEVYAWADFDAVYDRPASTLVEEWLSDIMMRPSVARAAGDVAQRRFTQPSLFEQRCPHYVPAHVRAYRRAERAVEAGDTAAAEANIAESLREHTRFSPAVALWARLALAHGQPEDVVQRLLQADLEPLPPQLHVLLGDALSRLGQSAEAVNAYDEALRQLPQYARAARSQLLLRRAVASRRDVVAALTRGGPPEVLARRLDRVRDPSAAARILTGLSYAAAGDYEPAARYLRTTVSSVPTRAPGERSLMQRQVMTWLAEVEYLRGRSGAALQLAAEAAAAARDAGDFAEAERLEAFRRKIEWVERRG